MMDFFKLSTSGMSVSNHLVRELDVDEKMVEIDTSFYKLATLLILISSL